MHTIHHKGLDVSLKGGYASLKRNMRGTGEGRQNGIDLSLKKVRDPHMVIIRNKFTKEIVDLEVCTYSLSFFFFFFLFCLQHL